MDNIDKIIGDDTSITPGLLRRMVGRMEVMQDKFDMQTWEHGIRWSIANPEEYQAMIRNGYRREMERSSIKKIEVNNNET